MSTADRRLDRRTLLAGTAAAAGAVTLGARQGKGAPSSHFHAPALLRQEPVTIRIAQFGSLENAERAQGVFDGFTEQNPDIRVEVFSVDAPDWDQYFARILTLVAAGETPDICFCATEGLQLFGSRLSAPLDEYVQRDQEEMREYFSDVAPSLVEAMMYEGSLYSLPVDFNAANIFYNKQRFEAAGAAQPTESWTVDDFTTAMQALAGDGNFGFSWTNRHWGGAIPWMYINGGNPLTEEKAPGGEWLWPTFYADDPAAEGRGGGIRWANSQANSAANVEALQYLVDLTYEMNAAPSPAQADSMQSQVVALFGAGQIASFPAGSYIVASLDTAGVEPDVYDVTYMPQWQSQRHQFGTAGYVIMNDSPNKDAAWELLKYRASADVIRAVVAGGRSTPSRRSLCNEELWTPELGPNNWQVFYNTLDQFPNTAPIPAPPPAVEMANIFTRYVGIAMSQDQTPQEALDGMHDELTTLLAAPAQ